MFHQGDLNSGISQAISEGKLVACFVREAGNEEARTWEEEWLGQKPRTVPQGPWRPAVGEVFATKAVILRINLGSPEATFLNAFCPVTTAPMFLVIHNGQVLEKLEAGMEKQEFIQRVSKALGLEASVMTERNFHETREAQGDQGPEEIADAAEMRRPDQHQLPLDETGLGTQAEASQPTTPGIATPASTESAAPALDASNPEDRLSPSTQLQNEVMNMTSLFPDRAQRIEAEKAKREAAEKADRAARQNARRKEAEEAHAINQDKGKSNNTVEKEKARRDWLVQQNNRKDEAKKERERILAQIEADKQDRKARSQRPTEAPSEPLSPSADAASKRRMGAGGMCNLMIRLFDGSSVKGRFEPSATLAKTVRDWINETTSAQGNAHAADVPFTFKQILAPQPSRSIEVSEEHQTLSELGLIPSATLVLAPVSDYIEAYSGGERGYMNTALGAAYGLVGTASSLVSSALSYVPGFGGTTNTFVGPSSMASAEQDTPEGVASNGSIKVKTMADQRAEAENRPDQQAEFYNGNSSAFQGRKDDDDDKGHK